MYRIGFEVLTGVTDQFGLRGSNALLCWFLSWLTLPPWRGRWHVPPKGRSLLKPHSVTIYKNLFFICAIYLMVNNITVCKIWGFHGGDYEECRFWDVAPCRSCVNRLTSVCSHPLTLVPRSRIILPWRWSRYVPPKRRFTQELHSATSQKTAFLTILSAHKSVLCFVLLSQ
jgi:hypothetical protein